jgi:glutathione S-transferase
MTPIEHPDYPAIGAYTERLLERPAYREFGRNGIA